MVLVDVFCFLDGLNAAHQENRLGKEVMVSIHRLAGQASLLVPMAKFLAHLSPITHQPNIIRKHPMIHINKISCIF